MQDTKTSNSLRKPLLAQHQVKIQLFPSKPTQVGKLERSRSLSRVQSVLSVQGSWFNILKKLTQKGFTDLTKITLLVPEERGEIPHAQSSIHWKLLLPGGTTQLFQLFLLQEGIKNEIL